MFLNSIVKWYNLLAAQLFSVT